MGNKGLGDMDEFIKEFEVGVILDGTLENLKESTYKLIDLLSDAGTPQRCRDLAEKYFTMDVGASKYIQIYSQILGTKI